MSSECFRFECLSAEGDVARFKMISFEEEEPISKSFYLELLLEFYQNAMEGFLYTDNFGNVATLSEEDYLAKSASSPARARIEKLHTLFHGATIPVTAAQYEEWKADSRAYDAKYNVKTGGGGRNGEAYYVQTRGDERGFVLAAQQEILKVTPIYLGQEGDLDGRNGLWSEVEFQVANPDMLAHLVPGTIWDSAMYELNDLHILDPNA
jgi:hypothetical protein